MKNKVRKFFLTLTLLALATAYVVKYGGPSFLKMYVRAGMGGCDSQPIFCMLPEPAVKNPPIDQGYLDTLACYQFPDMNLCLPKDLKAIKGEETRIYYKKRPWKTSGSVAYLLYREPGFFCRLFPQTKVVGINDDFEFVDRVMHARIGVIQSLPDAFFVIMKSLFTPDLGDQKQARIINFTMEGKRGFISFNLAKDTHYFDCNFFDTKMRYYKIYIKDKKAGLDLPQVFAIISTVKSPAESAPSGFAGQ